MAIHLNDHEAENARRFLLRRLPAEESEQFETRLLAGDDGLFETVKAVESELLDEFVRGAVSPEDRPILAERFENPPDRIRFAAALAHRAQHRTVSRRLLWVSAIAAAIALIVVGLSWRRFGSSPTPPTISMQTHSAPVTPARELHAEKIVAYKTDLFNLRDLEPPEHLELAPDVTGVALTIQLNRADRYPSYDVTVSRANGTLVWSGHVIAPPSTDITVTLPASILIEGDYQIAVAGLGARGRREDLGEQTITIQTKGR